MPNKLPKIKTPKVPKPSAIGPLKPSTSKNKLRCLSCGQLFTRVGMTVGPHKDKNGLICNGIVVFEGIAL